MRLPPLPAEQWDENARAALAVLLPEHLLNPRGAGNALATLVRHPRLTKRFLPFSGYLMMRSTLPDRLRELAILRVARRRGCAYEWTEHVKLATEAGLSPDEIDAAGRGEAGGALEAAVLAAVDELERDSGICDRTWAALGEHLDERQLMDLVFTVGTYAMLAMAFNTFGVEPDKER
ncbi:carboxymuconolactone decarboxylase family protein [Actinomadura darangshiensis]|uniref:Carboxymuconolactone decarboxylase family protein n=1 Tax=Actinomadura darangshiensis TaxID=705336 RepID=A0A4R5C1W2_9ACTN|nr:carboxymuconolactone decarboxylase family protein [Actinomadura darangshiensis]TDD91810.1 carboxymuconolactone decarboxylase family protein [Actinomadura darangshiensis]